MKISHLLLSLVIFLFSQYVLADPSLRPGWLTIPVKSKLAIQGNDGKVLKIAPACAFDVLKNPADGSTIDNSFHFYFKPGENDKLVVFFNGGGTCWDDATCLTSLVKGLRPTYNPSINQDNSPVIAGGIFDDTNAENPFKEWSKVYIPYCTGDNHVGSKTVKYIDDGSLTGYPGTPVNVKHHGFDNFLAVREWIKGRFPTDHEHRLKKLLVTGSSAGGYGATLNFPYIQDAFPKTNAVLLSDAATAIVTQGFLDTVIYPGGNWNLENTLHKIFLGDFYHHYSVDSFNATLIEKLTATYPRGRFAQYTTEFDAVQTQFLKIMTMIDGGFIDPALWGLDITIDGPLFGLWNWRMENSLDDINLHTNNYQYYMGEGSIHTVLTDAFATASMPHPFYDEHSAEGVWFLDWINRLVNSEHFHKESLMYSPTP